MKIYFNLFLLMSLLFSCKRIASDNPFDEECSKDLFTPQTFTANQTGAGIELRWNTVSKNISGYKAYKSIDNGSLSLLATLPKDRNTFLDTNLVIGKSHNYILFAYANLNESNRVKTSITPNVIVKTGPAADIQTYTATLGGLILSSANTLITSQGIIIQKFGTAGISSTTFSQSGGSGLYSIKCSDLEPNTSYTYYAFARDNQGKIYDGNKLTFSTNAVSLASLNAATPKNITSSFATIDINILDDGGSAISESGIVYSLFQNPTINQNKIINSSGNNLFTLNIKSLLPNTKYYVRGYAINTQGIAYSNEHFFTTTVKTLNTGTVTDIEGNIYRTVTIGNQVWMAENLRSTKYNNGLAIQNVSDSSIWASLTSGAFCWYKNSIVNKQTYGGLYNYYAVNNGNLCPTGWHVPTDFEWDELITFLGGNSLAGGKMKTIGTDFWFSPNTGATNSSGFSALPGGSRRVLSPTSAIFSWLKSDGVWWSSTTISSATPTYNPIWSYYINYNTSNTAKSISEKQNGNSVRCIGN